MFNGNCVAPKNLNESFSSKKLSSLFKNKDNLDIFKRVVIDNYGYVWSDIQDSDVYVTDLGDIIESYVSGESDNLHAIRYILKSRSFDGQLILCKCDDNIVRIGDYYFAPDKKYIDNRTKKDIKEMFDVCCGNSRDFVFWDDVYRYIDSMVYMRGDHVNLLKTLYKTFVLCCYDSISYQNSSFKYISDSVLKKTYDYHDIGCVYDLFTGAFSSDWSILLSKKNRSTIVVRCDDIDYEFDFSWTNLTAPDIVKKTEAYADVLYSLDTERNILRGVFKSSVMGILGLSAFVYRNKTSRQGEVSVESLRFSRLFTYIAKSSRNDLDLRLLYLSYVLGKCVEIYRIVLSDEHDKSYRVKVKNRQIDNISGININVLTGNDDYMEYKYLLDYIYKHDDVVHDVAKKLDTDDGRDLIDMYNSLLLVDKCADNTTQGSLKQWEIFEEEFNPLVKRFFNVLMCIKDGDGRSNDFVSLLRDIRFFCSNYIGMKPKPTTLRLPRQC